MIYGLDLFSGIGGIGIALNEWVRTIAYCEQDRYAQSVLLSRMQSGDIDTAPIFEDVRKLHEGLFITKPQIIFAGFPCQDISVAGNGVGLDGERSGLFFEIIRLVREIKPVFIFLENVPAIRTRGLDVVLKELTAIGYDCRWTVISASSIGACHKRERWFLLAYANSMRLRKQHKSKLNQQKTGAYANGEQGNAAHAVCEGLEINRSSIRNEKKLTRPCGFGGWKSEPTTRGRDHGVQNRMDRLKCLGNSVVPFQVKTAFKKLIGGK